MKRLSVFWVTCVMLYSHMSLAMSIETLKGITHNSVSWVAPGGVVLVPLTEAIVDKLESMDKTKSYKCRLKSNEIPTIHGPSYLQIFEIKSCVKI